MKKMDPRLLALLASIPLPEIPRGESITQGYIPHEHDFSLPPMSRRLARSAFDDPPVLVTSPRVLATVIGKNDTSVQERADAKRDRQARKRMAQVKGEAR